VAPSQNTMDIFDSTRLFLASKTDLSLLRTLAVLGNITFQRNFSGRILRTHGSNGPKYKPFRSPGPVLPSQYPEYSAIGIRPSTP
jgi:hypothetical protein